eukprot:350197-Chlamydomonas_euryale.AAC.3
MLQSAKLQSAQQSYRVRDESPYITTSPSARLHSCPGVRRAKYARAPGRAVPTSAWCTCARPWPGGGHERPVHVW